MNTRTSGTFWLGCVVLSILLTSTLALAGQATRAGKLWQQMRAADVNSAQFAQARGELKTLLAQLPAGQKVAVATALMQRGADDSTNATALGMFSPAGLPLAGVKAILDNPQRTWPQRVLVRTYYRFCRPEYETRLNPQARLKLVGILAKRLASLAGQAQVPYGEQRLMHHTISAVLSRYAGQQDEVPQFANLLEAMRAYAAKRRPDDPLAITLAAWTGMNDQPKMRLNSEAAAKLALGHWEPLVRMKASAYLGSKILEEPAVGQRVLAMLSDPRDEVRASAASVFSYAMSYKPEKVIPAMVKLLAQGRGTTVEKAAAETLIAHSDEAAMSINLLLDVLERKANKPGPKRTASIFQTLSYLINDETPAKQKQRLLSAAMVNLEYAPRGALRAMEALGPYAKPAVVDIKRYRDTQADRFTRQYINRHVLQAIGS